MIKHIIFFYFIIPISSRRLWPRSKITALLHLILITIKKSVRRLLPLTKPRRLILGRNPPRIAARIHIRTIIITIRNIRKNRLLTTFRTSITNIKILLKVLIVLKLLINILVIILIYILILNILTLLLLLSLQILRTLSPTLTSNITITIRSSLSSSRSALRTLEVFFIKLLFAFQLSLSEILLRFSEKIQIFLLNFLFLMMHLSKSLHDPNLRILLNLLLILLLQ